MPKPCSPVSFSAASAVAKVGGSPLRPSWQIARRVRRPAFSSNLFKPYHAVPGNSIGIGHHRLRSFPITMITIANDGQNLITTNYWDSEYAKMGLIYLTWNAGAARLLLPDVLV